MTTRFLLPLLFLIIFANVFPQALDIKYPIKAVKIYLDQKEITENYSGNYDRLITELKDAGINAVFSTVYTGETAFYQSKILPKRDNNIRLEEFRRKLKENNISFAAICQIFYDPDVVEKNKGLIPVDQNGNNSYVNWQKMVCPTDSAYRKYKIALIREVAQSLQPDIISLDFIRYPVTWEIIPPTTTPNEIRNFCFCQRCLEKFEQTTGYKIPDQLNEVKSKADWILTNHSPEWTDFKETMITSFVKNVKNELSKINPAMKIAVHTVPWNKQTFDNGIEWIAGQDLISLSKYADIFTPMIYHKLVGRDVNFILSLVKELY